LFGILVASIFVLHATAQTAVPTAGTTVSANTAVKLSPFEVRTDSDTGYLAAGTLAGSRLNTSLMDTPANPARPTSAPSMSMVTDGATSSSPTVTAPASSGSAPPIGKST
jgi:hypothetical protein